MITNFPKKKSYNPGGLRSFRFVPRSWILGYPPIINNKITGEVTLLPGREWLTGYATAETLAFEENGKDSPNGVYYDQSIPGFAPGDHEDLLDLIQSMEGNEFVALVVDARGQTRLVGGYGYPLKFISDYSSGTMRSDGKGFSYEFTSQCPFRAPVYKG